MIINYLVNGLDEQKLKTRFLPFAAHDNQRSREYYSRCYFCELVIRARKVTISFFEDEKEQRS